MVIKEQLVLLLKIYIKCSTGDELLLSDALNKLKVEEIKSKKIHTIVQRGGKLKPYQGVNKKGGGLSLSGITQKDKSDLKKISFVRI